MKRAVFLEKMTAVASSHGLTEVNYLKKRSFFSLKLSRSPGFVIK